MLNSLYSITFNTTNNFKSNLNKAIKLIEQTASNSFLVLPELAFSGYSYDRIDEASAFSDVILDTILPLTKDRFITFTAIVKKNDVYYNSLFFLHNNNIVHTQAKNKLFALNDEKKFFCSGNKDDIKIVEIDGIKFGFLICFELRFIEFWQILKGCDVIAIPSMWGKPRKEHLNSLTKSLAITNQCFVVISNSKNSDMANSSGIINPFGIEVRDDRKNINKVIFDKKVIKKMRRYMDIGLK